MIIYSPFYGHVVFMSPSGFKHQSFHLTDETKKINR